MAECGFMATNAGNRVLMQEEGGELNFHSVHFAFVFVMLPQLTFSCNRSLSVRRQAVYSQKQEMLTHSFPQPRKKKGKKRSKFG